MTSLQSNIIDGVAIANDLRTELRQKIHKWITIKNNRQPKLVMILIGSDLASHRYVQRKLEAAKEVGINGIIMNYPSEITEKELLDIIEKLNNDNTVDGIIVQLPLPEHIDKLKIGNAILCDKDVDGFTEKNIGRLCLGLNTFIPCAALAVNRLIQRIGIETKGKNAVIVGTSKNFGLPIAMLMHNECKIITSNKNYDNSENMTNADDDNDDDDDDCSSGMAATVTMCNLNTPQDKLKEFCKIADILISVIGVPHLIKADMVKSGACVIDVGITPIKNRNHETVFVGDVDFEEVKNIAGYITPVPGGIGPITITMLMVNTFKAAKLLVKKRKN